jgi:DNA-binding response OmpR family regulator
MQAALIERTAFPLSQPRVLLVDDDPGVGRFLGHAVQESGCSATVTGTAEAFRESYRSMVPDVVILDLALARSDGIELLKFLAEESCTALVLIVSGFDERVVEAALRLGCALGLNMGLPIKKPAMVDEISAAIAAGPVAVQ